MSKKMLINASHSEEHRAAIVEDGALTELEIEVVGREQTRGNIYKAVVVRVETGLQAAFVDYGADRLGFLQMGEIHPLCYRRSGAGAESKGRPRINDILQRGQELLVQVVKEERGTKGAALTTYLSLPGRYMVLMPESDTKGVSRKIEEESQRKKLKSSMASMNLPENMGYIVRTAGIGQTKEELKRDFDYLLRVYDNIQELARRSKAPALVYKESNLVIRMIRDYFSADIDEVLVDDAKVFQEAKDFFQQVMPEYARLVKLHQEKRPIFSRYQIEEQIETISKNKVPLPSGGSIVIDSTEALVAIDVNSGKMASEQGVEATAYKTNLEAAAEVGRQLRLRDLGGLIVIDFIDMRDRKHIRDVEKCLKEALKMDKARVTIGHISSQFSLLEMSRQRIKATLAEGAFLTCPHCEGSGRIKSTEAQAVAFMRKLQTGIAKGQIGLAEGDVPMEVATYLLNSRREELLLMERQHKLAIVIRGCKDLKPGQFELTFAKREKEEQAAEFVDATLFTRAAAEDYGRPTTEEVEDLPAEEMETEAVAEADSEVEVTEVAEGSEEAPKKKRKRRRRKKKNGTSAETPSGDETAEGTDDEDEEEELPPEVPSDQPQESTEISAEAAEGQNSESPVQEEAKPAKKRRRRRKKPAGAPTSPSETEGSDSGDAPPISTDATEEKVETTLPMAAQSEMLQQPEPGTTDGALETESTPKKRPTRSRSRKPAGRATSAPETPSPADVGTETGPKPEETAAAGPAPIAADQEQAPVAKPARKPRAPRKKAAEPATDEAVAKDEAKTAEETEKPKPKRAPRPRKAPVTAPEIGEPEAKPPRRAPRKKATETPPVDETTKDAT
ncbi:Rne/Rng family ribonuclease [Desulfuromonas acetexigens]|uniref:Ribonuclease G n=1 Tax=Trichloromonas acetexigens TaxID=38815 RepID=A0A550JCZ5_9BACT|nr:Rne/Rng family ribonuclease [Desulfuromonas acetexigens]TRO81118.1 Rne/Rng family ribonuclease [Desulfuromonas acetexigens]